LEGIYKKYQAIFGEKDKEGDEPLRPEDKDKGAYIAKWGWYETLYNMTNGDLTKWDEILKWGVYRFLNTLTFIKDKQKNAR